MPSAPGLIASMDAIDQKGGDAPVLLACTDPSASPTAPPSVLKAAYLPSGVEAWQPMHCTVLPWGLTFTWFDLSTSATLSSPAEKPLSSPAQSTESSLEL